VIIIETARIRLRHLEAGDWSRLVEYRSDPNVARYQSWETMTIDDARELIAARPPQFLADVDEWYQLAIADKITDEIIGDIGLCRRSPGNVVEIGFTLAPAMQGRGLAEEACRAAIEFVFASTDATAVKAIVDSRNTSAIALVKRLGMTLDHTEQAEFKGAVCSELHFVVTSAD
jgi:RimJ/RimL family protein N-acetyltransferase